MKTSICLILLSFLIPLTASSQCSSQFGSGLRGFQELCLPGDQYAYDITIAGINDSTFSIQGLFEEPQFTAICRIDCATMSFEIDSAAIPGTFYSLTGDGLLSGNTCTVSYKVYALGIVPPQEQCTGTYQIQGLGIQPERVSELLLWPNPASEWLNISLSGAQISVLSIVNMQGQVLKRIQMGDDLEISMAGLTKGAYILIAQTEDGQLRTQRFALQ